MTGGGEHGVQMSEAGARVLGSLLEESRRTAPKDVPALATRLVPGMGLRRVEIFLVDMHQELLVPLPDEALADQVPLAIDSTLAGWCYRTTSLCVAENDPDDGLEVWLPMLDGVERVGVLRVRAETLDGPALAACRALSSALTLIVLSKATHSDTYRRLQRREPMRLPAEMVWAFMPPRALGTDQVVSTAVLEPAYDLGGDAFDHSLVEGVLHTAILDSMGHDLAAGLTSSVAMAGCRNARRSGSDLGSMVVGIDRHLAEVFPDRYCTGVFGHLDLATGLWSWINCGHPVPLLIREERLVVDALDRPAELPLGLGLLDSEEGRRVHQIRLEPGDRVLLYTDGVVEARSATGEAFGQENFIDFVIRATAAGETAHEALRRLIRAVLRHHEGRLTDDVTILMFEWRGPDDSG